jgi:hypothetical protein
MLLSLHILLKVTMTDPGIIPRKQPPTAAAADTAPNSRVDLEQAVSQGTSQANVALLTDRQMAQQRNLQGGLNTADQMPLSPQVTDIHAGGLTAEKRVRNPQELTINVEEKQAAVMGEDEIIAEKGSLGSGNFLGNNANEATITPPINEGQTGPVSQMQGIAAQKTQ